MELQNRLPELERAGYTLFAISYDPVEVLAAFAEKRGVSYPLLSDEGSRVIRELGLLNEHLAEQQAFYGVPLQQHQQGVAYPGLFVLDEHGTIVEKRFEQSYRVRPAPSALLAGLGSSPEAPPPDAARVVSEALEVAAWVDPPTWRPFQQLRLNLLFRVAPGLHVYGTPIPDGYVPLTVEIEPREHLVQEPVELPEPRPFRVEGLDEPFVVHEGSFRAGLTFSLQTVTVAPVELGLRIRYQACGSDYCLPPDELRLQLQLEGQDVLRD